MSRETETAGREIATREIGATMGGATKAESVAGTVMTDETVQGVAAIAAPREKALETRMARIGSVAGTADRGARCADETVTGVESVETETEVGRRSNAKRCGWIEAILFTAGKGEGATALARCPPYSHYLQVYIAYVRREERSVKV